jgi:hypothetical protein
MKWLTKQKGAVLNLDAGIPAELREEPSFNRVQHVLEH